jgi:hypothetical protein
MLARALVVGVLSVGPLLLGPPPALAQQPERLSWDEAAALTHFPVWRPERTFGLRAKVFRHTCDYGDVPDIVSARWGGPGRKLFSLAEFFPQRCGDPGESRVVRTVRIRGERVAISVYCPTVACDVDVPDGRRWGYLADVRQPARPWWGGGPRRTMLNAFGARMSLRAFVAMLRSLRVVDLARPTVKVPRFLSSDGSVWCGIGLRREDDRWCSSYDPQYGASLAPDGTLQLCGEAQPDPLHRLCIQNWDREAFRLADGQRTDVGGFVCTDAAGAITCTAKATGTGFRVDRTGSAAVPAA